MNIKIKKLSLPIFVWLLFYSIAPTFGCSLALHDWQLKFYLKIPINAPFIPLSEVSVIKNKFIEAVTDRILWVIKPGILSPYINRIIPFFDGWINKAKWNVIPNTKSVIKIAQSFSNEEKKPLIIGSDKCFLKIAVFLDANSKNNCCQIVLAQDSRIRCIFQDQNNPWAQEFNMQSWFSLIFYRIPILGNILSFSCYPIEGSRSVIYDDPNLVEFLVSHNFLTKRPDLVVDPYAFDFPELPE